MKSLALAVQMYLTDYNRFCPCEHNAEADAYVSTAPGGDCCNRKPQANPFLRQAVILDECTKNRDIYRCPSAKVYTGPGWIVPDYGRGHLAYLEETQGMWGRAQSGPCACGPCGVAYPPGWGGTVTDSIRQHATASEDTGATGTTLGFTMLSDVSESQIVDAAYLIVCGDMQRGQYILGADSILSNLCRTTTCGDESCCSADWQNCPDTQTCGLDYDQRDEWFGDPGYRAKYAPHMGGANLGFADGHAKWWTAQGPENAAPGCDQNDNPITNDPNKPIRGLCPAGVS